MIERKELENLYENELQNKLKGLESLRKKVKRGQIFGFFLLILAFILFAPVTAALEQYNSEALPFIAVAPVAIIGAIILFRTYKKKKIYRQKFKQEVVSEIVKAIDPTWQYNADQCITSSEYRSSDLPPRL